MISNQTLFLALAAFASCTTNSEAFVPSGNNMMAQRSVTQLQMVEKNNNNAVSSRRDVFSNTAATATAFLSAALLANPENALAAPGKAPTEEELARIKIGYERMTYLLDNFEQETTICRENGGECKRDADPVRRYMGLRSTTDPLFQIEKIFAKVKYMDVDPDNLETFFEASEEWNTAVNMSNSMAFISQFGEYNPGGGKDEVLKYLEEAKKQVVLAKGSLQKIMTALEIQ